MRWLCGTRGRIVTSVAGMAALSVLAACGSGGGNGGSPAGNQLSKSESQQSVVAAANKEGALTWITTFTDEQVPAMVAAFNKKYPKIKVNAIKLSSEIVPRITTEQRAGKYDVDVVSDSANDTAALFAAGAVVTYDSPNAPKIPGFPLPEGYRNVVYLKSTVIAYNPQAVKKDGLTPPTSWEDLTKPQWKGKFNIVANESGVDFYLGLITEYGHAKALDLVKRLGANKPQLGTSHTEVTTQVLAGEPAATATAYSYLAEKLKKENPGRMDYVNTNPLLTTVDTINIVKNAPHPNAAKVFLDWLESPTGQNVIVKETGHASMSPGAKNDPMIWNPTKWKPAFAKPDVTADEYNQYQQEYTKALGYSG